MRFAESKRGIMVFQDNVIKEYLKFVSEDYRGHRISEKLIDFANKYAQENGFDRTYIPSEHTDLYEKFGYCYLKDIVNYGNGTDRMYVKEL